MAYNDKKQTTKPYKSKNVIASLEFALQGIRTALLEERNIRIHFILGLVAIIAGVVFKLTQNEWLWLLLVIFLVIIMELLNTISETLVDLVTDYHFHPLAKKVKDMAAGAVLLTAGFSVLVGLIIFLPKIWQLLF